jgi:mRNA-degrading endonuclease toxin of MazEF toxin-antitoxin module
MTACKSADIVLLQMMLPGRDKPIRRPVVVINPPTFSASQDSLIIIPVTTRPQSDPGLALKLWESYGLPKASYLKPLLVTVPKSLCVRTLSSLAAADHDCVRRALRMLIDENW